MKFYCDNCQAKYAISDEKVRGKVLKVRCKSCDHVITVREPRAPAASSVGGLRGLPPSAPSRAAWHYAINGKSFGPYDEAALALMFESGEIGDAAYVWRESFGADWKPARDIPQFATAINKGSALRPRNKTIGISAALSAVNIDARPEERDEEEGFVPGQAAASAPEGLDKRMEGLRDRLKQHNTPSPEAKRNPFAPASSTPAPEQEEGEGVDATSQMDRGQINAMLGIGANAPEMPDTQPEPFTPEPSFEQTPEPDLADQLFGDEQQSNDADFSSNEGEGSEDLYSFGGVASGGESSIDFSKLSSPSEMQDNDFAEGELVIDKEIKKQDEDGGFQVSNSLLIQMGDIQKQGRGKRVMAGIGIVAFLAVVGTVAVITAQNTKKKTIEPTNTVFEPQKKELVFKTYAKDELGIVFELEEGEEILTVEDSKAIAKEMEAEEAKIARNGGKKPRVIAENTRPNKKPGIDDPGLRGVNMGNLLTKKSGLDSALEESKAGSKGSEKGLATAGSDNGKGTALGTKEAKKADGPDWDSMKSTRPNGKGVSALDQIRTNDTLGKGESKPTGPKLGDAGVLSKDAAKAGFKKVRRSVQLCHQRQTSRGLPLSSAKVHITVEIQGTGNVSGVKLEPASFKHSVFETCMQEQQRRGRWRFEAYGGKTVKIKHTYVLQ